MKIQLREEGLCIFESALFRTSSTVITTNDLVLVVDPNWLPDEVEAIKAYVDQQTAGRLPVYLLFTHSDYDHIIGYKAFPDAKVIASGAFVRNTTQASVLKQINDFDDEYYIKRIYPIEYPHVDFIIEQDASVLELGQTKLIFWQAPGHNPDGLFTLVESTGVWIAGDYLSNIEFPYIYHSSYEYEETLSKAANILQHYQPKLLVTGHGDHTHAPAEIQKRITESQQYIKSLRQSIETKIPYPTHLLWDQYAFPGVMGRFHQENIDLIKRELSKS